MIAVFIGGLGLSSCGKVTNQKKKASFDRNISFLTMENQCEKAGGSDSPISIEIKNLYTFQKQSFPFSFAEINPRIYNYDNPLILSLEELEKTYNKIRSNPALNQNGEDLYYLYNESRRFEDQKCDFSTLSKKRIQDIRPFLTIAHQCFRKYQDEKCADVEFLNMSHSTEDWVKVNTVNLCKSFSRDVNCNSEYIVSKKNGTLAKMINKYYDRFENERYLPLFKLRPSHLKYGCIKENEKTVMSIKVLNGPFDSLLLARLLSYVESTWQSKTFSLNIRLVDEYADDVVRILPTDKSTSYVPDDNNRIVYLSTLQEVSTQERVLAHEFGHVLGFPDCYIEFFDETKKELVYYEISKNNTNIMCSLKEGVRVDENYFSQLEENSCLFNQK